MRAAVLLLLVAGLAQAPAPPEITLRIRVFDGADEVTSHAHVTVYKAGDRSTPIAESNGARKVAPGFYDAQVLREQDGRLVGIKWAERLVVMAYPDEAGEHLEVINLRQDYGALEVHGAGGTSPDAAIFATGAHDKEIARPVDSPGYKLFVVPAGTYDVRVGTGSGSTWHSAIEVPADRTRFLATRDGR
jgi:hypothetical protein